MIPKEYTDEIIERLNKHPHIILHESEDDMIIICSKTTEQNISFLNKIRGLPESGGHLGGTFISIGNPAIK